MMIIIIITKFSGHYPVVERADKFENGCVDSAGAGDLTSLMVFYSVSQKIPPP